MKDLYSRMQRAMFAVVTWLLVGALNATGSGVTIAAVKNVDSWTPTQLQTVDTVCGLISILYALAYIASIVFVAMWIYRANENAHAVTDTYLSTSPGWNVGYFFIPILCVYKPFKGLREIWEVSAAPDAPGSVSVPGVARWWWGLWIVTNIIAQFSFRISMDDRSTGGLIASSWLDILTFVLDVPMSLLLIQFMRRLTALQAALSVDYPADAGGAAYRPAAGVSIAPPDPA